ncbi:MurR/RpiR family transcriptional regulator [Alkalibacterium kapii]|uniref:RpiR family transcriptional regulator n=1 Tax=Alkalibacterium kapii TaxID=426704 RepID=A0A511AUP7_9LACT|nr:MurR/RpiR family transcriptional regulator [Alkalibacterium kapii]GEK91073.1 RpiR family transcriptional regulator [Alkalibacterium kapii]
MNQTFKNKSTQMRIRSIYTTLSDKERVMAEFILDNPEKIIHGTISGIAEELSLADSTVFRFCKKLGYKGFQDLKISLATETANEMKDVHEKVSKSDDEKTILEKIFHSNIKTLEDTLEVIDDKDFARAVDVIIHANKVELFGFGGSNVIAMDGYHKFIRTGLPVSAQTDSHMQLMSASQLKKGDVAILISHTGHSKDILDILETVKAQNVVTICITGFTLSPLSQGSDLSLFTLSEETDFRSEALASRIAQLSILDALYVNVMASLENKGQSALKHVRKAIQKKRL